MWVYGDAYFVTEIAFPTTFMSWAAFSPAPECVEAGVGFHKLTRPRPYELRR